MSDQLERRYQRLLRLYPKDYRGEREAEILATLMDTAQPGQRRPARREAAALILGALRARAGSPARQSPSQIWLSALRLSALLLLAHATAQSAAHAGRIVFSELLTGKGLTLVSDLGHPIAMLLCVIALVAVARGSYLLGILTAGAAFAVGQWAMSWLSLPIRLVYGEFWQLPLAILVALPLLWHRPAAARSPLAWLLAVPLALLLLPTDFDASLHLQPFAMLAVCLGCLLWAVIDVRAPIAASVLLLGPVLSMLGYYFPGWANGRTENAILLSSYAGCAAVLTIVAASAVRRRLRI
jgi:hypothetical protein